MIDQFLIFRSTGQVEYKYQVAKNFPHSIVNSLISDVIISERKIIIPDETSNEDIDINSDDYIGTYSADKYTVKYSTARISHDCKLIFTMCYSSLITYRRSDEFINSIKALFLSTRESEEVDTKFNAFFNLKLKEFEASSDTNELGETKEDNDEEESKDIFTISNKSNNNSESSKKKTNGSGESGKKIRKWGADGSFIDYDSSNGKGDASLDFSVSSDSNTVSEGAEDLKLSQIAGNTKDFGKKSKSGAFLVNDLSDEMDKILKQSKNNKKLEKEEEEETVNSSKPFGFLRNILGGKKIDKSDVLKVKTALKNHLIKKNVAPTVANNLVNEVEKDLLGTTTEKFTTVDETARKALEKQLIKLLTPNTSIDLLNEIQSKKSSGNLPYVISVVGVNGVGKSTNLSKLAFWLLQNNYRVLITACDTFRSGAVEQLRTHVNNLQKLTEDKNMVELFEGGYGGSDLVSKIATGAIKYAKEKKFDIVLLDTAGRRHNDSHLMQPLASFAKAANPDKLIMVGEALVGTDSVMQAQNFNKAFGAGRHLDFFIISKCDTVGDLIGSMVNMVYATGIPILFVGTGQTYTDLRTLSVEWAVRMLMS
ncbi:hypothetical protein B5S28_g1829 [[Candida] boidinii]|nr:hypothetical protein B5S28_g1829 [[Candida] boidinii]OWB78885.1 hypothetical protein B5S32_g3089 [[Candida] boidinii]